MKLPRAILFDHDGVLVASEPIHWMAWKKLLAELGIPYAEAELRAMVGVTAPIIMKSLLDHYQPGWSPAEYDLDALALRKNDYYLEIAKANLRAYPGVLEGLQWLRKEKIKTAVVSNAKRRELIAALESLGLAEYFDVIISRDDVSPAKPHPAPYLKAAAALSASPQDCIAVEDSPTGLEAALRAEIPTAAVMTNFARELLSQPVAGHPELKPIWVLDSIEAFFCELKKLSLPKA